MKRYNMVSIESNSTGECYPAMREDALGEYVLHSDHEAALKEAVAARDDMWVSAVAEHASFATRQAIADEMTARGAAHD